MGGLEACLEPKADHHNNRIPVHGVAGKLMWEVSLVMCSTQDWLISFLPRSPLEALLALLKVMWLSQDCVQCLVSTP